MQILWTSKKHLTAYTGILFGKSSVIMVFHRKLLTLLRCSILTSTQVIICGNEFSETFQVTTGVKQECLLSTDLFILGIHWVMNRATMEGSHCLRWNLFYSLEDLDFAYDIVLLSQRHSDSQFKTSRITSAANSIWSESKCNTKKTKDLRVNGNNSEL